MYMIIASYIHIKSFFLFFSFWRKKLFLCYFSRRYFAIACYFFYFSHCIYWSLPSAHLRYVFFSIFFFYSSVFERALTHARAPILPFMCLCVCVNEYVMYVFVYHLLFSQYKFCETMHKEWYGRTHYSSRCFDLELLPQLNYKTNFQYFAKKKNSDWIRFSIGNLFLVHHFCWQTFWFFSSEHFKLWIK